MIVWRWKEEENEWQAQRLEPKRRRNLDPHAILLPLRRGRCGLLARGDVTVNGLPPLAFRVLEDRDEIRVNGEVLYFSVEAPAEVVRFVPEGKEVFCGRCKGKMQEGEASVQCQCGAWHHQTERLSCWTYDGKCSSCDQPTAGISWRPEPLRRRAER